MSKQQEALDMFGEVLVKMLKDNAITSLNHLMSNHYKSAGLQGLQKEVASQSLETKELIRDCVTFAITTGVHGLLLKMSEIHDTPSFDKTTILFDGIDLITASDGIEGEYMLSTGWERRFSEFPTSDQVQIKHLRKNKLPIKRAKKHGNFRQIQTLCSRQSQIKWSVQMSALSPLKIPD
jgi:hypothetical protein